MSARDLTARPVAHLRGLPAFVGLLALLFAVTLGAFAGREPLLAVLLAAAALTTVLVALRPEVATLVVVGILYSNAAVIAVNFHGVPYIIGASLPLVLVAPIVHVLIVRRQPIVFAPTMPLLIAFFIVQIVSTLASSNPQVAFVELQNFAVEGIGLYFLITNVVRTPEMLRKVIWALVLVGAFLGTLVLVQWLTNTYDNSYFGFAQPGGAEGRTDGPIGERNRFAQVMLMLFPLALLRLWDEPSRKLKLAAAYTTVVITISVVLTYSRGGAVGLGAVLALLLLMRYLRLRHLAVVGICVAIVFTAVPNYKERLFSIAAVSGLTASDGSEEQPDGSIRSRATENLAAFLIFADHPALGVGPGLYQTFYRAYADRVQDYSDVLDIRHKRTERAAHNLYLGVAAETGAIGLACFLGILLMTLHRLYRARRAALGAGVPSLANMADGFTAAIVAYMVTGIFLHLAFMRYFWLMMALAMSASVIAHGSIASAASRGERTGREPARLRDRLSNVTRPSTGSARPSRRGHPSERA